MSSRAPVGDMRETALRGCREGSADGSAFAFILAFIKSMIRSEISSATVQLYLGFNRSLLDFQKVK